MEFKIEEKNAFRIVGVSKRIPIRFEGPNEEIIALAKSITEHQKNAMQTRDDLYPHQIVSASYDFDDTRLLGKGELTHMIGYLTMQDCPSEELECLEIKAGTWAVFPSKGAFPQTLQDTWGEIYSEWLPNSKYVVIDGPEISFTDLTSPNDNKYSEIWLPVRKEL